MEELRHPEKMVMKHEDWRSFNRAQGYHICDKKKLWNDRVRDHCHITGKFRSAAHNACNLKWCISPEFTKIPVVFHNLGGCDDHLLMSAVRWGGRQDYVHTKQHGIVHHTFSLRSLQFIGSVQFMLASLDKLVNSMAKDGVEGFVISRAYNYPEKLPLLLRKGVYRHNYMDSMGRFQEQALPSNNIKRQNYFFPRCFVWSYRRRFRCFIQQWWLCSPFDINSRFICCAPWKRLMYTGNKDPFS